MFWASLRYISPLGVGIAVFLQVMTQLLINFQWYWLGKISGFSLSFWKVLEINCRGSCIEAIAPGVKAGGEITRVVLLSRVLEGSKKKALFLVGQQKMFSLSAFFLLLLVSVNTAVFEIDGGIRNVFNKTGVFLLGLGIVIFGFSKIFSPGFKFPLTKAARGRKYFFGHPLKGGMGQIQVLGMAFLSLVIWLIYPAKLYLLVRSLIPGASYFFLSAATLLSYLAGLLPIFPGGVGGFEGVMAYFLTVQGLGFSEALAVALVFRFITFWLVVIVSTLLLYVPMRRKNYEKKVGFFT